MSGTKFTRPEGIRRLDLVAAYLVKHGDCPPALIGALLGVEPKSALVYLRHLRGDGRAHRREDSELWSPGPDIGWLNTEQNAADAPPAQRSFACRQTGRARRDYLVEALFGPAARD